MGRRCSCAGPECEGGVCCVIKDVDVDFFRLDAFLGSDWWSIVTGALNLAG